MWWLSHWIIQKSCSDLSNEALIKKIMGTNLSQGARSMSPEQKRTDEKIVTIKQCILVS